MKKYILLIVIWIGCGISFLSCQKEEHDGEQGKAEEEYTLPAPELTISNPFPCINEEVEFSFTTDVVVTQDWNLGDNFKSAEKTVKHTYTKEGTFKIGLELSDGKGGTVQVDTTVSVMGKRLNDALEELVNNPSKKWICAHRGNTYYGKKMAKIPENSIKAIEQAIKTGIEMAEIDVRTTSDHVLVISHNETVDEATNGTGAIAEMTLAKLKSFYLKDQDGNTTAFKIPTLEEALLAGRGKIFFDLDLKDIDPKAVVGLVDSLHMLDRVAFYRGSSKTINKEISDVNPQCIIFPYVKNTTILDYWSENPRIKMIQLDYTISTATGIVTGAAAKGMASFANYLNEPGEAILSGDYSALDNIVYLQFQIIQTDYAEYVKAYLEK
ncbi:MAG: glycerophosphodiester phosphodiesterase family protein [Mangrovibacterium sp.]